MYWNDANSIVFQGKEIIMKSKICVMTSVHKPFDVRIFHKQCRTLIRRGYDVTLVAPYEKDEIIDGVKIKAVQKPVNRKQRFIKTGYQVYRRALKINADIYHIHDPELLPYAQLLRLHRKKVIYDMHENLPRDILTKKWIKPKKRKYLSNMVNIVERFLFRGLYIVFAETSYKKDYRWVNNWVDVLNMPDVGYLIGLDTDQKYEPEAIAYVGGVSPDRGSMVMLEAIALLQNKGLKCSFHCIGPADTEHQNELKDKIENMQLNDIYIYGYMVPTQAWEIIRKCHVGMAILKPDPNFLESYPTKLFEYMALGIPVITSNFPLYKEVVERNNCGYCVNPESIHDIADAMEYLLINPIEANMIGANGKKAVIEKYNWEQEANKMLKMYSDLEGEQ